MSAPVPAAVLTDLRLGVAHLTINRPDKRNALNRATIAALSAELRRCADDPAVRVVQLTGAGEVFCAGADLGEMQSQAKAGQADNLKDAEQLAAMLALLDAIPKPTLARVNGDGYGGALGLLGARDIAGHDAAKLALPRCGSIIPAVISVRPRQDGERCTALLDGRDAERAGGAGNCWCMKQTADQLDMACARITEALLKGAPKAQAEAKRLIRDVAQGAAQNRAAASKDAAARLAGLRVQAEAQEGFSAFFAKRKASWRQD